MRSSERLERSIPGGNTRSLAFFPPYPLVISSGSGCRIRDADGNEFIDLLNNYTASVHGHALPAVNEAMSEPGSPGDRFPCPQRAAGRARGTDRRPGGVGREGALRELGHRGRHDGRARREGLYRKGEDSQGGRRLQRHVGAGADLLAADSDPYRAAMPEGVRELVRMVDYNDVGQLEAAMEEEGDEVAAIILEPVTGTGVFAGTPEYFAAARRLADEHGALLICDEVITLRLGVGGFQEVLGVRPDLTTMGKIIGGGLPVGAFGGRADVMEIFDPRSPRHLHHSGTFNGNLMTMAAGCVTLDLLTQREIERINALGERLAEGLRRSLAERPDLHGVVNNCGSLLHVNFGTEGEVRKLLRLEPGQPHGGRLPSRGARRRSLLRAARLHEHVNRDGRAGSRRSARSLLPGPGARWTPQRRGARR